jgi:glucose-6-phosphate-specific signal transduction histidine kinase
MPYSTTLRIANRQSRARPADSCCGSLAEILDELLRVAHRADAYEIHVETFDYEGRPVLSVYDNGSGIESPRDLLALDAIGWRDPCPVPEMMTR